MTRLHWCFLIVLILPATACAGPVSPGPTQGPAADQPVYGGQITIWKESDVIDWDPNFEGRGSHGMWHAYNQQGWG